jgi:arsenical pump membrane protein
VLAHERFAGAEFARRMALPWVLVVLVTIAFVAVAFRLRTANGEREELPPLHLRVGAIATAIATGAILALHNPALPVLAVGLAAIAIRSVRPKLDLHVIVALFALAVCLGTLARLWDWPSELLGRFGSAGDAAIGAIASVLVNNLPAATLLSAQPPPHPLALLVGLNLGPNLLFTGSLSAYLWYRAARNVDARPSLRQSSLLGLALVPLTIGVALAGLSATG